MTDIEILNQMFKDSARVLVNRSGEYSKPFAILTEPQQPTSTVTINGLPEDAIIIKVDRFEVDKIFNGSKGECKRADYVVIADTGSKKRVLYVELKKTSDAEHSIIGQLKGAECFITYCKEVVKAFWNKDDFLSEYEPRFVCFGQTGSVKTRRSRVDRLGACHNTPERMMKIRWPRRSEFNHLVGA